jgi:predicted nucleotidyltransferase
MKLDKIKHKILSILKSYNIKKAGLFGSVVRGELQKDSDSDILVEINGNISLLDFIGIKLEIEEELNRKVDLVKYAAIKPSLRENILKGQVAII